MPGSDGCRKQESACEQVGLVLALIGRDITMSVKEGVAELMCDGEPLAIRGLTGDERDRCAVLFRRPARHSAMSVEESLAIAGRYRQRRHGDAGALKCSNHVPDGRVVAYSAGPAGLDGECVDITVVCDIELAGDRQINSL